MDTSFDSEHAVLIRYLLGELTAREHELVGDRTLLDERYAELCDEVEADLVDAYVAGRLTPDQRRHFETRYMITKQRREAVQTAYLLRVYHKRIAQPAKGSVPSSTKSARKRLWSALRVPAIAAAIALVAIGSALLVFVPMGGKRPPVAVVRNSSNTPAPPMSGHSPKISVDRQTAKNGHTMPPAPGAIAREQRPSVASSPAPASPSVPSDVAPGTYPAAANQSRPPLRLAMRAFDYSGSTVKSSVNDWFHHDVNIGEGIRALLIARMAQAKTIVPLDASAKDTTDAFLSGYFVIFGRDELARRVAALGSPVVGRIPASNYADKAVVAIKVRIDNAKTLQLLQTTEIRGLSLGTVAEWEARGKPAIDPDMTGAGFAESIIGEAASDAVNKVAAWLEMVAPRTFEGTDTSQSSVTPRPLETVASPSFREIGIPPSLAAPSPDRRQMQQNQFFDLAGKTSDEVRAILGSPVQVIDLRPRQIYFYRDIAVTFTDGKVVKIVTFDGKTILDIK
jgi:hypothetical protein